MSDNPIADALPQGAARLDDWGVIRASGSDSRHFLHNQLTQDVDHLKPGEARLAGYCSAKGRLLATFVMWSPAADEVLLACSADLLAAVMKRLSMFVLRAKCKLVDASAELPLWGLAGPAAAAALDTAAAAWTRSSIEGGEVIRLPDAMVDGTAVARWLWHGADPTSLLALPTLQPAAWRWLEAKSGVARIVAATSEQFVPQMVNLEVVGGVDFQKGCYPGQEIVARSQYRGTLKRRGAVVDCAVALQPGTEIFHSGDPGQPAGRVVLAGSLNHSRHAALLELKLAALEGGSLHAETPGGPLLTPTALPYALPAETT